MKIPKPIQTYLRNQRRGYLYFTLIEIIIVVAIIIILATVIIANLPSKCRSKLQDLLGLLDSIDTDATTMSTGAGTVSAAEAIVTRLRTAVDKFKELKQMGCLEKVDKKTLNDKIDALVRNFNSFKESQEEPVKVIIEKIITTLTNEKYPDAETM